MNLTGKREKFVLGLVSGKSQRQAYIDAGYNVEGKTEKYIDDKASKLYRTKEIMARYTELVDAMQNKALWTREQAIKDLIEVKEMALSDMRKNGIRHATQQAFNSTSTSLNKLVFEDDLKIKKQEIEIKMLEEKLKQLQTTDDNLSPQERRMENFIKSVRIAVERDEEIEY